LGHRRLSIIDLEGGKQPLSNEDGTVTVVFNGEIYNFGDLRRDLMGRGHTLATRSDTEVIVHLYEDEGPDCVRHFRGMFGFALWDETHRRLLLVRDRLGVKPLYYMQVGRSLFFASEIKSLLAAVATSVEIDPRGLRRFLAYRYVYGNGTLFKGIQALPPGHLLIATEMGVTVRRYWDVPDRQEGGHDRAASEQFLGLLEESVKLRMISDVPLGAFLSGGLDSSVITALMAKHTDAVKTFSIGFVPGEESELAWAKVVADHVGADHHAFELGSEDFFSLMQKLVWHNDEPMIFPASIPLYLLSRESKRVATVMLAGEGADELLAGYPSNIRAYWLSRVASKVPLELRRQIAALPLPARARRIAARFAQGDMELISGSYRLGGHDGLMKASRLELPAAESDDAALLSEVGVDARGGGFLDRLLYFQLKTYLEALLMKQDKMSMAASIETRVPYLDHHLVSLAFSLPDSAKVQGMRGKRLLREVAGQLLPQAIITRPKQGFPVPIAQWFRQPGNPFLDVLLDPSSLREGLIDATYVERRIKQFKTGAPISMELWAMLNLEMWRRTSLRPAVGVSAA
jgi:asparagine synthase (glutamine-hydrolysing)